MNEEINLDMNLLVENIYDFKVVTLIERDFNFMPKIFCRVLLQASLEYLYARFFHIKLVKDIKV